MRVFLRVNINVHRGSLVQVWANKSMKHPVPCAMYFGKTLPVTTWVIIQNNALPSITILIFATTYPKPESSIVSQVAFTKCFIFYILCDDIGPSSITFFWSFLDGKPQPKPSQASISNINWHNIIIKKNNYALFDSLSEMGKNIHQNVTILLHFWVHLF